MTEDDEAVVGQSGRLKNVSDRVRGGETCVLRRLHVDATVDVVVVQNLWACGVACGARGGGVSFSPGEVDGVVAEIGGSEGPK